MKKRLHFPLQQDKLWKKNLGGTKMHTPAHAGTRGHTPAHAMHTPTHAMHTPFLGLFWTIF